jgi:hypothetical protein
MGERGGRAERPAPAAALPLRDPRTASARASICPFLRRDSADGLTFPTETPDSSNACVALDEPLVQSMRQQELVCLVAAHADCPRYLRGILFTPAVPPRPASRPVSPAVAASLLVLLVATVISVSFVAAAGGLSLPPDAAGGLTNAASPTVAPSALAVAPSASAGTHPPTVAPPPTSTVEPTPKATPRPTPRPTSRPTPRPTAAPSPSPTSDRYAVLTACPDRGDCWIYVVRPGDNLFSIAHWFGVPLESIYAMNPWTRTSSLRAGQELLIPTPTR